MRSFIFKRRVAAWDPLVALDFLSTHTGLSRSRIKDAMDKGAVWHIRNPRKGRRLRCVNAALKPDDRIALYYDPAILSRLPQAAECLADQKFYSVWNKPAGLLTQGTLYADHCSLLRRVEMHFREQRKVFPVHRLDRETRGLVMVAHGRRPAASFSKLFQEKKILKKYRAEVLGDLRGYANGNSGILEMPLDDKPATTNYTILYYQPQIDATVVDIHLHTGRYHQIRRHFDMIGHPVIGDPRYGCGNKNTQGLRLAAVRLSFTCPFSKQRLTFETTPF